MIPFDEVADETWQTLNLILGKPSLLCECLAAVASDEDVALDATELEVLVRREIAQRRDGLPTNSRSPVIQLSSEQWQFIADVLVKVSEVFRLPGSFDWTDATETAFLGDCLIPLGDSARDLDGGAWQ
jgi:hypothetical protein